MALFFFFFLILVQLSLYFDLYMSSKSCCCLFGLNIAFNNFFSHITMVSGCDRELSAHFYSAASLKNHVPDT